MKKHHKIFLGSFGTVVIIFMIVITILLNGIIVKQTIENKALRQEIQKLEDSTNGKINELAVNVINTKTAISGDLISINQNINQANQEIDLLKANINEDFSGIIEESIKSVLTIRTLSKQGTGFIINDQGYIVTNEHILANDQGELSNLIQIITEDNKIYMGEFIGSIKEIDLALLKINANYPKLELEEMSNIKAGDKVIAIGNPEGFQFSVTDGIISAINRKGYSEFATYIQTNAELNQGNSGGPLINTNGKVVGMNNFKLIDTEGMGFALEVDKIKLGVNTISQEILNITLIQ
jgi:S1-C subfamily serine protease